MRQYEEETERHEALRDRDTCRRKYLELIDSGQVESALTVVLMKAEPGDDPGAVRMALISDGLNTGEARDMVRHAMGALSAIMRSKAEEPTPEAEEEPERLIEAHGRLAEQWLRYAAAMELDTAPARVYTLARQSFYAGIASLYAELIDAGDPRGDKAAAAAVVDALTAELREFCLDQSVDCPPASRARH
jgi:hypothetical protein